MQLNISESAANRISHLAGSENGKIFRVSVEGGGCSGFQYKFDFSEQEAEDLVFESHGAKVLTDQTSLELLNGSTLDFVNELGGQYFTIKNPNAKSSCGCGSSFSL